MYKKGQFFIVAALVIVSIIMGLTTIYNSATTETEDQTVYDLSSEISFEAAQTLDQGTFSQTANIEDNIKQIVGFYKDSNPNTDIVVIFGNDTNLKVISYITSSTGSVSLQLGGTPITISTSEDRTNEQDKDRCNEIGLCEDDITLILSNDATYSFKLRPGQYFYVVLTKASGEDINAGLPQYSPPSDSSDSIIIDLSDEK